MAVCPKCGEKLRLTQWRPDCPHCGVNMVYYKANDRLLEETEKAEIEHALFQPKLDRAKAAFFGSKQAIFRVVLHVLPFGALFLPLIKIRGETEVLYANVIRAVKRIGEAGAGPFFKQALGGDPTALPILLLLISAVLLLVSLICLPMSLGKHGKMRDRILDLLTLGSAVAAAALFAAGAKKETGATLFIGAFVYLALLSAAAVYDRVLEQKGLKVQHTVCYIGGLPSDGYFALVEHGWDELHIKNRMIEALTAMQEEVRAKAAEEEKKAAAERAARK